MAASVARVQLAWTQAPDRYGTGVVWALLAGGTLGGRRVPVLRLEVAGRQPWDLVLFGRCLPDPPSPCPPPPGA